MPFSAPFQEIPFRGAAAPTVQGLDDLEMEGGLEILRPGGRESAESPALQIKSQGAAALPPFPLMTSILQVFPCKADVSLVY